MPKKVENRLKCSFCGKSQDQVRKLIAGPGVYICDECVDLCIEILSEEMPAYAVAKSDPFAIPDDIGLTSLGEVKPELQEPVKKAIDSLNEVLKVHGEDSEPLCRCLLALHRSSGASTDQLLEMLKRLDKLYDSMREDQASAAVQKLLVELRFQESPNDPELIQEMFSLVRRYVKVSPAHALYWLSEIEKKTKADST